MYFHQALAATVFLCLPGGGISQMEELCLGDCTGNECVFTFEVNIHASELGYFTVKECGDEVMPTLGIEKGKTYKFKQYDTTNYYHPLGIAYYPDGAHDDVDELEPGIAPPGSASGCEDDLTCPAPMYLLNGEYLGKYSNNADVTPLSGDEDFGLDFYEPDFFLPIEAWIESGDYSVMLKFDVDDFTDDIFYFCHIHQFMSGRMKFVNSSGMALSTQNKPEIPYEYDTPSAYDKECGTHGLEPFQLPNEQCPSSYVCNPPQNDPAFDTMVDCLDSMNCAMQVGMTTNVNSNSAIALFNHQMIPHHQNAVNMCKTLFKSGAIVCDNALDETSDCTMYKLCMEIINGQNYQIQQMRGVLASKGYAAEDDCVVIVTPDAKRFRRLKSGKK